MLLSMPVVEFDEVDKSFGDTLALADVSLEFEPGQRVGLLGPNGSGKTTALRLMLGLYHPERGAIRVLGQPPSHEISERIGYLPEERGLYREMRVLDLLRYYARLKGAKPTERQIDEWLARLGITEYKRQKVRGLSKGTAQKVQFISTVLHDPELVILDEPFSGLDPVSRKTLHEAIVHLADSGKTLIFSTHDMNAAENLCDRFLMLHRGKKVLDETRAGLREVTKELVLRLTTEEPLSDLGLEGVLRSVHNGTRTELTLEAETDPQRVLSELAGLCRIIKFEIAHPSLEDLFLRLAVD
jgi:ABC-2 type transport system ATP-binding protein